MLLLTSSIIIPNHTSALEERATVPEYLDSELVAGRMSGPLTFAEMERVCQGSFFFGPKKRVCRHLFQRRRAFGYTGGE